MPVIAPFQVNWKKHGMPVKKRVFPSIGQERSSIEFGRKPVVAACDQGATIINELDELVETGFGDREVERVEGMISELGRIETESDELLDAACRSLFALENELGVATVYWHQLLLWIADMADYAERVGNRLRLLIAS